MSKKKIILASKSPRRQEILRNGGIEFNVKPSGITEDIKEELSPRQLAEELSKRKAQYVAKFNSLSIVIGADTVVAFGNRVLDKPKSESYAIETLRTLSGKTHQVFTGFTIIDTKSGKSLTSSEKTDVTFRKLTDEEIKTYVNSGDPMDKAGAYGIQSGAGVFIDHIDGDYLNVVGLPSTIFPALEEFGIKVKKSK